MVKIAVDGRPLQGQLSGVGKYVLQVLIALAKQVPDCHITIFTNKPLEITFSLVNVNIRYDTVFEKIKPLIWSKFLLGRLLKKEHFDFYFFGGTFTPVQKLKGKKITVVHDLNHIYAKETMSKLHYLTHVLFYKKDIAGADFIIANSHGTASKLKSNCNITAHHVLHPPINEHYKIIDKTAVAEVLGSLGINYKYILTVATQEPRKNLDKTIHAFLFLKKQQALSGQKLLLVGGEGWKNTALHTLINSDEDIIRMGYVAEKHLPYIYNGASSFVFPSKYEGYGMPATEALLCGIKPIVSDIEELREATSGHAYYIDPENLNQYTDCILTAISNQPAENTAFDADLRMAFDNEFKALLTLLKITPAC
ncbi:glycosyltransferase family 4 protein [Mucilaginibacter angelicae]|uniref:Glycosyltransferase family 4 protein n=1 Tax=Mucilaginibacter angelicae TaxID=869718 RepID=A0ABV6L5Q8_9SPHI